MNIELKQILEDIGVQNFDLLGAISDQWIQDLSSEFNCFPVARTILKTFGGLTVDVSGAGIDMSKSGFEINPLHHKGEKEYFLDHEEIVGRQLYPIGVSGHEFDAIVVDDLGRGYWLNTGGVFRYEQFEGLMLGVVAGKKGERIWPDN